MRLIWSFLAVVIVIICLPTKSFAATTVNNVQELKDEIEASNSSDIVISESFNSQENIDIEIKKAKNIAIKGPQKKLNSTIVMNVNINSANTSEEVNLYFSNFQFDGEKKKQVGIKVQGVSNIKVNLNVENSAFENSTASVLTFNPDAHFELNGAINMREVYVHNNESSMGGIVNLRGVDGGGINRVTFANNKNSSMDVSGALAFVELSSDISISFSNFIENEYIAENDVGGGAIFASTPSSLNNETKVLSFIYNSISNNKALKSKGGAIYAKEKNQFLTMRFIENTINDNTSKEGGAIFYEGNTNIKDRTDDSENIVSEYNLYYGNNSIGGGGGAIKIDFQIPSNLQVFNSNLDTFYKNGSLNNKVPAKGGAINITNNSSMEISSTRLGNNIGEKNFENIFIQSDDIYEKIKTFGIDNGKDISGMSEKIFGKYPIDLQVDQHLKYRTIGSAQQRAIAVWLPLIPNVSDKNGNELMGIASSTKPNTDLISSLLYDANGGNFNLPELTSYNGEKYYEGSKPKYYSDIKRIDSGETEQIYIIKDAKKDFNIERAGYTFLGWSTKHDSNMVSSQLNPGNSIHVLKQKKLFAIWQPNTYQLTYYGTSKSSGTTPAVTKAKYNTTATIKSAGTMKRKGHKFLGWSKKANQSKADVKYALGTKVKMTGNVKLYPVWKANKYTLKYNNTSKTSGAAPKSVSATYGKSYTIKNAGTMKRKGYKFLGWSKKAKQTKVDAKLKPGKKLKVLGTTNLYPVWKKAK